MPAEDEPQVPEGSRAGWGHWPGALVWACLQRHWQEGPCCSQPCNPRLDAKGLPRGTMCRVPFLPPSKLSLMVVGHCLHRRVVSAAAFETLPPNAALGMPWCACWVSSALWALSGGPLPTPTPSVCLEPCPAPGCSSPALPRGFPACPRASPQWLMCRQGCWLTCPCVRTRAASKEIPRRHEENLLYCGGGQAQELLPRQPVESLSLEMFRTT